MNVSTDGFESAHSPKRLHWLRWAGYVAGGLLFLILIVAGVGLVYEQIEESRDRRLNHPPGAMVDVGGYRLHIYCTGSGSPTVVLESGLGEYWLAWYKTQPQIATFAQVCSYDRGGLGWSDPSLKPRNSQVMAEELHTLLHNAGVPGPFVLVGHSLGGFNMQMYAHLYPGDLVGMVLVDSGASSYENAPASVKHFLADVYHSVDRVGYSMPFGVPRFMGWCGTDPPEFRSMVRTVECQTKPFREIHQEWSHFEDDAVQLRHTSLGDMPLIVLSHDPQLFEVPPEMAKDFNLVWESMFEDLLRLSSNSSRVIANGSGHHIQIDKPDVVIAAVRKIVEQSKRKAF